MAARCSALQSRASRRRPAAAGRSCAPGPPPPPPAGLPGTLTASCSRPSRHSSIPPRSGHPGRSAPGTGPPPGAAAASAEREQGAADRIVGWTEGNASMHASTHLPDRLHNALLVPLADPGGRRDPLVHLRPRVPEGEVLQLLLDRVEAQQLGQGAEHHHRLLGNLDLRSGRHRGSRLQRGVAWSGVPAAGGGGQAATPACFCGFMELRVRML